MKITNYDIIEVLQDIRQKVLEVPTHRHEGELWTPRDIHSFKADILEIIDYKIREFTE